MSKGSSLPEISAPKASGTPQSRRKEARRAAKKANKNHGTKRGDKGKQSKPR